nr:hypothetical protein Iba_chr07dCG7780 [Ipomoea batatas]
MVELQDLSDEVLAIKVSSLEVEKGKSKAVTKDEPTIDPREVEREFRSARKRASRISIAEKAMEGPRQTNGAAAEEEERPILMIEAAPPSLNEVPARGEPGTEDQSPLFARNAQEESARDESNASAEDEARLVPKSVILAYSYHPALPPPPTSNSEHDEAQGAPEGVVPLFTYPGELEHALSISARC